MCQRQKRDGDQKRQRRARRAARSEAKNMNTGWGDSAFSQHPGLIRAPPPGLQGIVLARGSY